MRKSSHGDGEITDCRVSNYYVFSWSCPSGLGPWPTFHSSLREDVTGSAVEGEENENEARKSRARGPWHFSVLLVDKCVDHKSSFLPGPRRRRVEPTNVSISEWRRGLTGDSRRCRWREGRGCCSPFLELNWKGGDSCLAEMLQRPGEVKEEKQSEHLLVTCHVLSFSPGTWKMLSHSIYYNNLTRKGILITVP